MGVRRDMSQAMRPGGIEPRTRPWTSAREPTVIVGHAAIASSGDM